MRQLCAFLLSFVFAFVFTPQIEAQNTPGSRQNEIPVYKTQAREVVVDVVVTKGDDQVLALHKQDFQVLEDGKPQAIDFFEEHTAKTLPSGAVPPLPKMPPHVYSNVPPAPQSDSVNVLLLDSLNTDQQDQVYVHNQVINFLKNMQPGIKVAIFTLSSKLRMVQGFTTDSSVLRNALNDPKYGVKPDKAPVSRSLQDKFDDVEHMDKMQMMWNAPAAIEATRAFQADFAGFQGDQRVAMTLEALQYLARYLAAVPGRKNLIWFSSNFPITVFPRVGERQGISQSTANPREYSKAVRETADMLTVSKVAVYPIGAEGMMSEHVFEANAVRPTDYEGNEVKSLSGPGSAGKGADMGPYINESAARSDKIMAMEQLATDTGGKASFNTNDLNAAMQHAVTDGAHYYSVAYSPTNKKMDGNFRRIEVKVNSGKYKLAYRRGYNADDTLVQAEKPQAHPLQPLMLRGMPNSTQLLYGVRVVPADPQPAANAPRAGKNTKLTGPTTRYTVDFMIRWTDVKLQPAADGTHSGKIQVELLAYDREGNALNWVGGAQVMSLAPDIFAAIQRSGVPAHFETDLPADKDLFLETGVYDW
jgi:VWFA-related protein